MYRITWRGNSSPDHKSIVVTGKQKSNRESKHIMDAGHQLISVEKL